MAIQFETGRPHAPVRSWLGATAQWGRTIAFVMVQEFGNRFQGSRLEVILTFLEPFILLLLFAAIRGIFRDRLPAFGTSVFVFFSTGVFPFYLFKRVSIQAKHGDFDAARRYPRVSVTCAAIALALTESVTMIATAIIWFAAMWGLFGLNEAVPVDLLDCALPIFLLFVLAFGIGLFNAAMEQRFWLWWFIYGKLTYHLPFVSGLLMCVDAMPQHFRDIMVVVPITHAITWFRVGMYGNYPHATLDKDYLIAWALGALMVGLLAHRATIRIDPK